MPHDGHGRSPLSVSVLTAPGKPTASKSPHPCDPAMAWGPAPQTVSLTGATAGMPAGPEAR